MLEIYLMSRRASFLVDRLGQLYEGGDRLIQRVARLRGVHDDAHYEWREGAEEAGRVNWPRCRGLRLWQTITVTARLFLPCPTSGVIPPDSDNARDLHQFR